MGSYFSKQFDPIKDIPNLDGRVAIVTGATSGLGFQTAQQLANHGAKVYLTARSESKALDTIKRIEAENSALKGSEQLQFLVLELSSVKSSKAAADAFLSKESRLDILINNAAQNPSPYEETEEGVSTIFASNHLGHFVFTTALLPVLKATARLPGADVRVINVTSQVHTSAPPNTKFSSTEDFKSLCGPASKMNTMSTMFARYGQGKLANILFTKELQKRWDAEGIPALSLTLHPGVVSTEGALKLIGTLSSILVPIYALFTLKPLQGAATSLFAATSPVVKAEAEKYKAAYLVPYGTIGQPSPNALDAEAATNLWETSERVVAEISAKGRI